MIESDREKGIKCKSNWNYKIDRQCKLHFAIKMADWKELIRIPDKIHDESSVGSVEKPKHNIDEKHDTSIAFVCHMFVTVALKQNSISSNNIETKSVYFVAFIYMVFEYCVLCQKQNKIMFLSVHIHAISVNTVTIHHTQYLSFFCEFSHRLNI